jgi:serine phosphatase RsbU (regulator of sigma subunit)
LALVIGDVAGHDMQAASVMGKMRSALRAYALDGHRPSEVLARLNRFTIEMHPTVTTTCVYAVYSAGARTVTWASAGHYPPLLVTDAGAEYLATPSARPPIGAQAVTSYLDMVQLLPPSSRLLLFTDGLIERRGHDIDEGLRVLAAAATGARPGAEGLCAAALAACLPQGTANDDVALLAVAIDSQPSQPEPLEAARPIR